VSRISRRTIAGPEAVEAYLRGNSAPRYMQRLLELEGAYQAHRRELEDAYEALVEECRADPGAFAARWRERVRRWSFEDLNDLIREHNMWYPIEVNLPMNPRTHDFVAIRGASYRRTELGPDWVLEHLPPTLNRRSDRPPLPRRAPREPVSRA
jgi:hypothetical protein